MSESAKPRLSTTGHTAFRSHAQHLLRLGLPIIIGQLGIILVGFVDNIMISRHSLHELAAASFVNNFLNLAIILGIGFSYGLTPLVAEAKQRQEHRKLSIWFYHSFFLNLLIALFIGGLAWLAQYHLSLFNVKAGLLPTVLPYYRLQVIGFVVSMLFNTTKQFMEGLSHTAIPMYITLGGNLLNIFLNWLLIYGQWGFPEWGIWGAGVATLTSRIAMLLVALWILYTKRSFAILRQIICGIRLRYLKPLLKLGLPVSVQMGLEAASFSIAVIFVAKLGNNSLAAYQIVSTLTTLGFMVYYGLGAATAIRVSMFRAQKDFRQARRVASTAYRLALIVAGNMIVLLLLFNQTVSRLFEATPYITTLVTWALIPVYLFQAGDALQVIYANALRGMAQVKWLAPFAALCHIVVAPLLCWLLGFVWVPTHQGELWQHTAIWFAFPISLSLLGLLLYRYFCRITQKASHATPEVHVYA